MLIQWELRCLTALVSVGYLGSFCVDLLQNGFLNLTDTGH